MGTTFQCCLPFISRRELSVVQKQRALSLYFVGFRRLTSEMGHKKRKNKTPEEPNNKKVAKLNSEDDGGNEEAATQKVTVEVVEKKEEVEPKKVEGNGSQNSGKKKKKKKNANKGFGFVTYKKIDERVTVCHLSTGMPAPDPQQVTARRIYV